MKKTLLPFLLLLHFVAGAQQATLRSLPLKQTASLNDTLLIQNGITQTIKASSIANLFLANYLTYPVATSTFQPKGNYLTAELEPAFTSSVASSIINADKLNWNIAYSWGNHAGLYPLLTASYANPSWISALSYSKLTGTPDLSVYATNTALSTEASTRASGNALKLNISDTAGKWLPIGLDFSNYVQKVTQNPTASLTGGVTLELIASGANLSYTLNWSAGRLTGDASQNATANITTVNVGGTSQSFSNPSAGASVTGTQAVTVVRNTNTTFSNTVTTSDSKTATATTAFTFLPKRYWGYSVTAVPTSSDIVASLGGGSELSSSLAKSNFTVTPSGGNQYNFIAAPVTSGHITSINIGGFESIASYTERTISVTNASGFVQNYYVLSSNNQLPTTTFNAIQ